MSSNDINIQCPHCEKSIPLSEALAAPILDAERAKALADAERVVARETGAIEARVKAAMTAELAPQLRQAIAAKAELDAQTTATKHAELAARQAQEEAEKAQRDIALSIQREVDAKRAEIERKAQEEANADAAKRIAAAHAELVNKDEKLVAAQDAQLEALRLKREAEEAKRETELKVEQRLGEELIKVRDAAIKERDEANRLQVADKDKQLQAMRDQIEELRRKGNSGSQQLAGEVLELDLLELLQQNFPQDRFERVPKGQHGGDVIHTVYSPSGVRCGAILWESKRTKTWQNGWLPKLRDDQRAVKADIAALATETLPDDMKGFAHLDGIWVMSLPSIVPVAWALRSNLLDVSTARRAGASTESAKDKVFEYLTTPAFRQHVTRIVEAYEELRADLDKEKKALASLWHKREKQLDRVLGGVSGMYGDLQGIAGTAIPALAKLDLPSFEPITDKLRLSVVGSDVKPVSEGDNK